MPKWRERRGSGETQQITEHTLPECYISGGVLHFRGKVLCLASVVPYFGFEHTLPGPAGAECPERPGIVLRPDSLMSVVTSIRGP